MLFLDLLIASSTSKVSTPGWVYFIYILTGGLVWIVSQNRRARKARHDDDYEDDGHDQSDDDGDDDDEEEESRYYGREAYRWHSGYRRRRVRKIRHPVLLVLGMIAAAFAACILIVAVAHGLGYVK